MQKRFKILIDLDRLKNLETGLGHVAEHFGKEIAKLNDPNIEYTFLVPPKYKGYFGSNVKYVTTGLLRRYFPNLFPKFDLWYSIHQDASYLPTKSTPWILTINDLNFLGEKTADKAQIRLKRLQKKVDRASVITVISQFTETAVRENLRLNNLPVHVIYCGVTVKVFSNVERPSFLPSSATKLLFSVGVVQKKKNYEVLIEFIKALPQEYTLIIAGNKAGNYSVELQKKIDELQLSDRIIMPGLISEEDKFWMYTNCEAVLFPSKFEGMGFPPVEAMRLGKPVFASTYSSIPEVSGDKAYYWENFDPNYMSSFFLEKIEAHKKDPNRPAILNEHSLKYTWENNAKSYAKLFKDMLKIR